MLRPVPRAPAAGLKATRAKRRLSLAAALFLTWTVPGPPSPDAPAAVAPDTGAPPNTPRA
jgi:hypothetical protein